MEERKIKPFKLPDEESVTMLKTYGTSILYKEIIFKLEDIVSIVLNSSEGFEVSLISGATICLSYDKTDVENLSYDELKTLWFKDMAIRRKEILLNDQRLETVENMLRLIIQRR